MSLKAFGHRDIVRHHRRRLIHDDNINAVQFLLVLSKRFSNHPFDAVSRRRFTTIFFRYCQAEPCHVVVIVAAEHCKEFIAASRRFFEHAAESGCVK
jgi:hypothetical protein